MNEARLSGGLEAAAARFAGAAAILAGPASWTYADLDAQSNALAHHLASQGVAPGQRVAVMMGNRVEFVVAVHGVSKLGAAAVLLSPAWKALEVAHATAITGVRFAVADHRTKSLLLEQLPAERILDVDDRLAWDGAVASGRGAPPAAPLSGAAEAVLVFSSGTTGFPKAVRHTHASLTQASKHWCEALGLGADDRFQVATPPSHILGLLNLLAAAEAGATVRLHPRFDLDTVLRHIAAERMTLEMAVAPIALAIANHPVVEQYDLSSLRYFMWGATPVTASIAKRVTARTGVRWLCGYGASEVPVLAVNPVRRPDRWRLDSAGLPPEGVELRVADLDTGQLLPPGETGEIQARSASVMAGYLPAAETADAFADGWYRTGDVGWLEPDGWVHLTDRCKEMIKVKGFQVAPAEIEAVLHSHPGVRDCAVFGVADEGAGELPVAAVQLAPGAAVTPAQLQRAVADALATYKQLREVVLVEQIPRLPSGKVLRRTLRDEWAPRLAGGGTSR